MNYEKEWKLQRKIRSYGVVRAGYEKSLFLTLPRTDDFSWSYDEKCKVPRWTPMLILSEPLHHVDPREECLAFLVLSCEGVGWIRVVCSPNAESMLGYLEEIR